MPPPLEAMREIACTLSAKKWPMEAVESSEDSVHNLRFTPGGRPFARVIAGEDVTLRIPVALASAGGRLRIDAGGVVVEGNIEAAEMPLYPAAPFVVSKCFVPNGQRRLALRSASPGAITFAVGGGPRLRAQRGDFEVERPCADVSLGAVAFVDGALDAAMHATSGAVQTDARGRSFSLRTGRAWFSARPNDDDPVAWIDVLDPPDDTLLLHPVRVLATDKGWTRIALDAFGGTVFGWVQSEQLGPTTKQWIDLQHDAFSILVPAPPEPGDYESCKRVLPLVAHNADESRLVGEVRAGTRFKRERVEGEWTVLAFEQTKVIAAEGATFRARTGELDGCR
jgi:hypothetical protein